MEPWRMQLHIVVTLWGVGWCGQGGVNWKEEHKLRVYCEIQTKQGGAGKKDWPRGQSLKFSSWGYLQKGTSPLNCQSHIFVQLLNAYRRSRILYVMLQMQMQTTDRKQPFKFSQITFEGLYLMDSKFKACANYCLYLMQSFPLKSRTAQLSWFCKTFLNLLHNITMLTVCDTPHAY